MAAKMAARETNYLQYIGYMHTERYVHTCTLYI